MSRKSRGESVTWLSRLITPEINKAKQEQGLERTRTSSTPAPRRRRARSAQQVRTCGASPGPTAKSNMKILVAVAVFFLVSTQLFAEEIGANDDLNYWSDWSDSDQIKEAMPEPFEHLLQRIARRPKPQQFFGLMGKRDAGHGQISHKRHKTDSFVGLMGKRALNSVAYERSAMQNYERRRK